MTKSLESFQHNAAKNLLCQWLREEAEKTAGDWFTYGAVSCRPNRSEPNFGVWAEYPLMPNAAEDFQLWDEDGWPGQPPTRDHIISQYGRSPRWIVDILVAHKGHIGAIIEVVHKHAPSEEKLIDLSRMMMAPRDIFVVPARWIMGQVRRPSGIPEKFRVNFR